MVHQEAALRSARSFLTSCAEKASTPQGTGFFILLQLLLISQAVLMIHG